MTTPFPPTTCRHILTIDDDQAVLDLLRDLLEDEGDCVTTWRTPLPAYGAIAAAQPDLIVLDYWKWWTAAGWSWLRALRNDPSTAAIPVVLCTGAAWEAAAWQPPLAALGVRVMRKPFAIDHLLAVIAEAAPPPRRVLPVA